MELVTRPEPGRNRSLDATPLSPFDTLDRQLSAVAGHRRVIPLHQGRTAFTTPVGLREWAAGEFDHTPSHDGPPAGAAGLRSELVGSLGRRLGAEVDPARVQVTAGITHALAVTFHAILQPGDEVVVLSPQWLFVPGLVRAAGGRPVELPWFTVADPGPADLRDRLTPRTRAIYLNTPNNPTGRALSAAQLDAILEVAAEHGLWVVADNAYEHYDFRPGGFVDPASRPLGRDRVFAAYSFSKTYGMTGYRVGYLLSPPGLAELARKVSLYTIYSVPTPSQFAALAALRGDPAVLAGHREFVRSAQELAVDRLRVPAARPDGGFYVFLDLAGWPGGADDFVARCVAEGVSLAPGRSFGRHSGDHARLCHSVVGPADLAAGIDVINQVYRTRGEEPR